MEFKYLDTTNLLISIIGLNLSMLGILFSLKYKVEAKEINLFGKKVIVKNTKIPLLIVIFNYFVIALYLIAELKHSAFQDYMDVFNQFGSIFFSVTIVTIIYVVIVYIWVIQYNAFICDGRESVERYLQFTSDVKTNSDILIVGGDLSFFGYLPDENYNFCSVKCDKILDNFNSTMRFPEDAENVCPHLAKCMLHNVQLRQLFEKHKYNRIRIRILCNKPSNTLVDKKYRLAIAELYQLFKENIEIRFYSEDCQELPMRGRLKTSNDGTREYLWQWKSDNDVFLFPDKWVDNTAIGKTIIHLYEVVLWNQSTEIDSASLLKYEEELLDYINFIGT